MNLRPAAQGQRRAPAAGHMGHVIKSLGAARRQCSRNQTRSLGGLRISTYAAGITNNDSSGAVTIPPSVGADSKLSHRAD